MENFGEDVDGCEDVPATGKLEANLEEEKALLLEKFGEDVDDEQVYDFEGTPWIKTIGEVAPTTEKLEANLEEVKALFLEKFGSPRW